MSNEKKTGKPQQPQRKGGGISQKALLERANRMARQQVNKEVARISKALGIEGTDKAKLDAKLAELEKQRTDGQPVQERYESRIKELEEERGKLMVERERLKTELNRAKRDVEKELRRRSDMEVEHELRALAAKSGIRDPDYALHLFGEHVRKNGDAADPSNFFEGLKINTAFRYLFNEETVAAGPKAGIPAAASQAGAQVAQATAPASSTGTPAPTPAPPGKAQAAEDSDVMDMKSIDFKRRTADKYGFRPGM